MINAIRAASASVLALLAAGCGGSGDATGEAEAILDDLRGLKPGEILIKSEAAPRVSGPWTLKPGGYLLHFEHAPDDGEVKLRVSLGRTRTAAAATRPIIDTSEPSGTRPLIMSGRVFVHIEQAGGPYRLRLTPRAK